MSNSPAGSSVGKSDVSNSPTGSSVGKSDVSKWPKKRVKGESEVSNSPFGCFFGKSDVSNSPTERLVGESDVFKPAWNGNVGFFGASEWAQAGFPGCLGFVGFLKNDSTFRLSCPNCAVSRP